MNGKPDIGLICQQKVLKNLSSKPCGISQVLEFAESSIKTMRFCVGGWF